jgi:hypothetical protein
MQQLFHVEQFDRESTLAAQNRFNASIPAF